MPIPDTTIRDDRERPTPRRHHQHHGPCVPDPLERYEIPDPVRSDAAKALFHCVRQLTGRDPCSGPNSGRDAVLSLLVTFVSADAPGSVADP
jgi:hypothetical protein